MLSIDQVNSRAPTCARCDGQFSIVIPRDLVDRTHLFELVHSDPIASYRRLRELTGCSLLVAKGTLQHVCHVPNHCNRCKRVGLPDLLFDCAFCGSLNVNLASPADTPAQVQGGDETPSGAG